jgi:hypothetical protein
MNRRQWLKATLASSAVISLGGVTWLTGKDNDDKLTVSAAITLLESLKPLKLTATGIWGVPQILNHCAQSVDYSLSGFPSHKSAVFKFTLGNAAFAAFAHAGKMSHSLSEPIPGAPSLTPVPLASESVTPEPLALKAATEAERISAELAIDGLITALKRFSAHDGPLAPHFAYGPLTKAEYELAHVMHLNNHLSEIIN